MKVRWTYPALKDLDEIEDYIAQDDVGRAADFVNGLIDLGDSRSA
jgi:plasmid stabilization system protein ParE